jgi:hypothetical protein
MQPPQLAKAYKPRKSKHAIVETLNFLDIIALHRAGAFPQDWHTRYRFPNIGLNCPPIANLVTSRFQIEITLRTHKQSIQVHWLRAGFLGYRPALVCPCGRRCNRLFHGFGGFGCRFCCNAVYASQLKCRQSRPALQAAKLRLKLGGIPQVGLTPPAKRKWKHYANYRKLRSRLEYLEFKARKSRLKQPQYEVLAYYCR